MGNGPQLIPKEAGAFDSLLKANGERCHLDSRTPFIKEDDPKFSLMETSNF